MTRRAARVLLCGVLSALALGLGAGSATAASTLHVIPFPGTPDAAPSSDITFSSLQRSQIKAVAVTGSTSGRHPGHLTALPDGAGTAFIPAHAFTAGEQVQVTAALVGPAAGAASGDPGATTLRYSFTVAAPVLSAAPGQRPESVNWMATLSRMTSAPGQSFHSAPKLDPPTIRATGSGASPGEIFLTAFTPYGTSLQNGPMILDGHGRLVWFHPVKGGYATNLEVQRYHGQRVLTWWQQTDGNPQSNQGVIVNRSYRTVARVKAGDGYHSDMHEFQLTRQGTALIDAYTPAQANLTSIGGPANGTVLDCVIQELDVKTGRVLWEWHALGHVPVGASYWGVQPATPYDFFHLNSIQQLPDGNLLVSARNTWAVYEIDKQTGAVIWTLGGRYSNFKVAPGARFEWQHDAHLRSDGILTVFDDASDGATQEEPQSSAKVLKLNTAAMTASLVQRYTHSPPVLTDIEGSAELLSNHDLFVGWGKQPDFSEYTAAGKQIFTGSLPLGSNSYRAYLFRWSGQPRTKPSVAVARHAGGVRVYVSWNGATQVAGWRVLGGSGPARLKALARAGHDGFETAIVLHTKPGYVAVQALSARGKVIGTSRVKKL